MTALWAAAFAIDQPIDLAALFDTLDVLSVHLPGIMLQTSDASKTSLLLLGRFGLTLDSGERISVSSKKGCALLAYLAMQPEYTASRERLATLLWGDRSDDLARQSLRQCLFSLRRELPSAVAKRLLLESDSVGLSAPGLSVDARAFAALADSGDFDGLARACDLTLGRSFPASASNRKRSTNGRGPNAPGSSRPRGASWRAVPSMRTWQDKALGRSLQSNG